MAQNVTVQQVGAQPKVLTDVETVGEIMEQLGLENHSVRVNGREADKDTQLSDYAFVSFGDKVKGGNK